MYRRLLAILLCSAIGISASAQTILKLNLPYACVGVINPSAEFILSNHSAVCLDVTYSPWESVKGNHLEFGMFTGEYRYYIKPSARGFYVSANGGLTCFNLSKPSFFSHGKLLHFKGNYSKGFGTMIGLGIGYEHVFRERWVVDAFLAVDWYRSWYNGYSKDGVIDMYPHRDHEVTNPDPFNGSSEFRPAKVGISIGYMICRPKKRG